MFDEKQQRDEYEQVDYLASKEPSSHKAMLISQGFNSETGDLETFVEHCIHAETTDNTAVAKFSTSDKDSDTKRKKKRSRFKEREENSKKLHKKTPHSIAISTAKTKVTPLGSEKSSRQGLNIR